MTRPNYHVNSWRGTVVTTLYCWRCHVPSFNMGNVAVVTFNFRHNTMTSRLVMAEVTCIIIVQTQTASCHMTAVVRLTLVTAGFCRLHTDYARSVSHHLIRPTIRYDIGPVSHLVWCLCSRPWGSARRVGSTSRFICVAVSSLATQTHHTEYRHCHNITIGKSTLANNNNQHNNT